MEPSAPVTPACAQCGAPFAPHVAGQTLCDRCQGLAAPEPPRSPLQDMHVASYRLAHEIGAGRFSTSWLAEDPEGRHVVLKLLRRYAPDPNSVQRFLAEAQRVAQAPELAHPHIARLIEGGVHLVEAFFLVYDAGGESTLADELRTRGRLSPGRALEICAQLAEGLATLHRAGIAHLDLKPANVGMTRNPDGSDRAILLDCATAHLLLKSGVRETAKPPLSTAGYLAPESTLDARSDVYALGAMLFQLLSGRLPVAGSNVEEILAAHREHPPLRLRDVGRRLHFEVERLVIRLLAKDPAQRPSIDEVPVLMRALATVADTAPEQEAPALDDPLPVVFPAGSEPEAEERSPLDVALERALMGEVPPQPVESIPGIPSWAPRRMPRWVPKAAIGLCLAAFAVVLTLALRHPAKSGPPLRRSAASPARRSEDRLAAPAPPKADGDSPPPVVPAAPRKSAYAKSFEKAQRALWTGKPAGAEKILRGVLKKRNLPAADRTRAMRMMGDAAVRRGNKPSAVVWYRKALRATDDPAERDRLNEALAKAR